MFVLSERSVEDPMRSLNRPMPSDTRQLPRGVQSYAEILGALLQLGSGRIVMALGRRPTLFESLS
jgi:hypothetical protein